MITNLDYFKQLPHYEQVKIKGIRILKGIDIVIQSGMDALPFDYTNHEKALIEEAWLRKWNMYPKNK